MMNTLMATSWVASLVYFIFVDSTFGFIYLACLIPFVIITQVFLKPYKDNTKRKSVIISSWSRKYPHLSYILIRPN